MILDYFALALKNLRKRKLRSWLTVLGVFIAIATLFVLVSLSLGLQESVAEQFRLLGTDKIFIQPRGQLAGPGTGGAVELTIEDVKVIDKIKGVHDLTYWIVAPGEIEFGNEKRFFTVIGFPYDRGDVFLESGAYTFSEGKFPEEGDTNRIAVGSQYKENNIFKRPLGERDKLTINGNDFRIKAIFDPIGNPGDDRLIYMDIERLREISDVGPTRIDMIIVQIEPDADIGEVSESIKRKLFKSRDVNEKTRDFTILTPDQLIEVFGNILAIITGFLVGVAGISLLVGGIGIANTMFTSVLERTKEIGIMKSIGARNKDILFIFVIESGLIGLVGGIIGILLGLAIAKGIEVMVARAGFALLKASTPFYLYIGSLGFAFLVGAISGTWPALRASKINTVDALRYE